MAASKGIFEVARKHDQDAHIDTWFIDYWRLFKNPVDKPGEK